MKDLILLVADKRMERALQGGLERPQSLGIRPVAFDFRQHPGRDGGTRTSGAQILALETSRFSHAMLVLDHEGSGTEQEPLELENSLDSQLAGTWGENAKAIVITPELDVWMWGSDNKLAELLHWPHSDSIRAWLAKRGFEFQPNGKPLRPKEALEAIFPVCHMPRSSATYQKIATNISLTRCEDPAFHRLRDQLQLWFPRSDTP
jgi:hypothetical protein